MEKIKKYLLLLMFAFGFLQVKAQVESDPAHWAYGIKGLKGNIYEIHLKCTIDNGWHIYAQKQTKDFIGTATKISFTKTPGLSIIFLPVERGKKEIYDNKEVGIFNYEYAGTVDFVQKVTIKPGIKSIMGMITYQTCTEQRCLPEKTISFTIPVP